MSIGKAAVIRSLTLLGLGVLASAPSYAQTNAARLNYVGQIDQWTYTMVDQHIGLFIGEGMNVLYSLAAVLLVWQLILALFSRAFDGSVLLQFAFSFLAAYSMLAFYDAPMPWGGLSFHQLAAAEARWIASTIDLTSIDDVTGAITDLYNRMEKPAFADIMGMLVYCGMLANFAIIWFLSFGITSLGYLGLGIGSLLGPIFIPFFIWPTMNFLFWGWLRFMLVYSFFRVAASAIIYVYAHVIMWFLTNVIGIGGAGPVNLGTFLQVIGPFTALNVSCLVALGVFSYRFASDLFSGHASVGNPFAGIGRSIAAAIA